MESQCAAEYHRDCIRADDRQDLGQIWRALRLVGCRD